MPPPRTLQILMAEDNLINQKVACMLLERLGHEVVCVANGREALDALALRSFDVVLMDVMMPVLDGLEATRRLRQDPALRGQYVLALTANAMRGDREACLEAGADDYLAKPLILEQLTLALERVPGGA